MTTGVVTSPDNRGYIVNYKNNHILILAPKFSNIFTYKSKSSRFELNCRGLQNSL